jgi:hypothetical protein
MSHVPKEINITRQDLDEKGCYRGADLSEYTGTVIVDPALGKVTFTGPVRAGTMVVCKQTDVKFSKQATFEGDLLCDGRIEAEEGLSAFGSIRGEEGIRVRATAAGTLSAGGDIFAGEEGIWARKIDAGRNITTRGRIRAVKGTGDCLQPVSIFAGGIVDAEDNITTYGKIVARAITSKYGHIIADLGLEATDGAVSSGRAITCVAGEVKAATLISAGQTKLNESGGPSTEDDRRITCLAISGTAVVAQDSAVSLPSTPSRGEDFTRACRASREASESARAMQGRNSPALS